VAEQKRGKVAEKAEKAAAKAAKAFVEVVGVEESESGKRKRYLVRWYVVYSLFVSSVSLLCLLI
jgi:hypothetical protein